MGPKDADTVERTNNLICAKDQYLGHLLEVMKDTRNRFVHRGDFVEEKGLEEVGLLKSVVESAIGALLGCRRTLRTDAALKLFYESVTRGDGELEERARVIRQILRTRKPGRAKAAAP